MPALTLEDLPRNAEGEIDVVPAAYAAFKERPYLAANGHTMYQYPRHSRFDGRPIYSSAWSSCVDDCTACLEGEYLPDW